jgi:hypothetical protein
VFSADHVAQIRAMGQEAILDLANEAGIAIIEVDNVAYRILINSDVDVSDFIHIISTTTRIN